MTFAILVLLLAIGPAQVASEAAMRAMAGPENHQMTTIFVVLVVVVLAPQLRNATARRGARKQSHR